MPLDPESLLTDWQQRIEQQTALTTELSRRVTETTASATSRGGEAAVTVDSSGGLAALHLDDQAMRLPARELAAVILETSKRAQAKLAQQMNDVVTAVYGSDSETASFIGGAYANQFPEQPDEHERGHDRR